MALTLERLSELERQAREGADHFTVAVRCDELAELVGFFRRYAEIQNDPERARRLRAALGQKG